MVERRKWYWLDWGLFCIHTIWHLLGVYFLIITPESIGYVPQLPFSLMLFASYFVPLFFWRQGYVHRALFPLAVLLTTGFFHIYMLFEMREEVGLIVLPTLIVGYIAHRKTLWWVLPIYLIGFPMLDSIVITDGDFWINPASFVNTLLIFGIGFSFARITESNYKMKSILEENKEQFQFINYQNEVLQQYIKEVEALSKLEERNRLARELHDTVGHTFTSVIMGMDAIYYLIDSHPEQAKQKLEVLRNVTRVGLEEVRQNIHQIAPEEEDIRIIEYLHRLVSEFAAHTNSVVNLHIKGECCELPRQIKINAIRCIQESLTNAIKHGLATRIEVSLCFEPTKLIVIIEDNGQGTDQLVFGFGLKAMKERLEALNGTLHVSSKGQQGTIVSCIFPI
ncbi:sensor histidine kinase [Marinicrinis lubricantis]|uniref:histidine kinase n=1 Tax=Marinicrinis lubricantis TaxID=2086470 RepID=A0ABW1IR74_9BACL